MCEYSERKGRVQVCSRGFAQFQSPARMWVSGHCRSDSLCSCAAAARVSDAAGSNGGIMICIRVALLRSDVERAFVCPLQCDPSVGPWVTIVCSSCSVALLGVLHSEGNGMAHPLGLLWIETVSGKR